ncbi:MAG TPA: AAA family ATPase, partial [Nitrospiria bacterium]|nr:AAA family ATPase [Nitrospiria bacterium]
PVIFIDEAESILGTRRSSRTLNISNTLVPMFCAEMDGIESLQDTVIILASNRPDLIDPAILRPGRIDRKIKIVRPGRDEAREIFSIYLKEEIPLLPSWALTLGKDKESAREKLILSGVDAVFARSPGNRVAELHLRNGRRQVLYRSDLVSGAMIASIVTRAKEKAIQKAVGGEDAGLCPDDMILSVNEEYREGDILPPHDVLDDWLKLLDHDPGEVTDISLLDDKRRAENEKRVI